jgi:uncharacterized protein (UPF0264 family)
MADLLVSVRCPEEAEAAVEGGAGLVDVKEPCRGPLGRADDSVIAAVCRSVGSRVPVSAALGELMQGGHPFPGPGLAYAKWGLAGCADRPGWQAELIAAAAALRGQTPGCRPVAVAYADWERAVAPLPSSVADFACRQRWGALLIDTWDKGGTTLLDGISLESLVELRDSCRAAGIGLALAGSLGPAQIARLRWLQPDWFAVRGSACRGGSRGGVIDPVRVRQLASSLERSLAGN